MSDDFSIDMTEFNRLVITPMRELPHAVVPRARSAIQFNAQKVKESWRSKLAGNPFAPRVPTSITYDTEVSGWKISAEVGALKGVGRQGGVALLLEYGAPRKNLSARGYGLASLQENIGDLEHGMKRAIDDALGAVGW